MSYLKALKLLEDNDIAELKEYLLKHRSASLTDIDNNTLLHHACMLGNYAAVKLLVSSGFYVDTANVEGHTPLCDAALNGDVEIVAFLIKNRASVNPPAYWGSPLHYACQRGFKKVVYLLVLAGAKLNVTDRTGRCALHLSIINNHEGCVKVLLKLGANPNELCMLESPLHMAVKIHNIRLIRILLSYGANPRHRDKDNKTPTDYTNEKEFKDVLLPFSQNVPRLLFLTRITLRNNLNNCLPSTLNKLELPKILEWYMAFPDAPYVS